MNKLILAVILMTGIGGAFAESPASTTNNIEQASTGAVTFDDNSLNRLNDSVDVLKFRKILHGSELYAMLMSLSVSAPGTTEALEYVALLHEAKEINKNLDRILLAIQKNNELMSHNTTFQG